MISLAKLSIRRPRTAIAVWLIAGIALSVIGFGVSKSVSPSVTVVPNTQSSRATALANAQFGPSQLVPILLEGPTAALDRQGPKLVAALTKRGVVFERYPGMGQDALGIWNAPGGDKVAWFKDPDGNLLSVSQH